MNKLKYLVYLSASIFFILSSCKSNSSDSNPSSGSGSGETYELSQFIGEWERTNSTSDEFVPCPEDPPILEISQSEIRYPFGDENGCMQNSQILEYTFDGKKFSVDAGWDFEILSHSGDEFKWNDNFDGSEETYARVE